MSVISHYVTHLKETCYITLTVLYYITVYHHLLHYSIVTSILHREREREREREKRWREGEREEGGREVRRHRYIISIDKQAHEIHLSVVHAQTARERKRE